MQTRSLDEPAKTVAKYSRTLSKRQQTFIQKKVNKLEMVNAISTTDKRIERDHILWIIVGNCFKRSKFTLDCLLRIKEISYLYIRPSLWMILRYCSPVSSTVSQ